VVSFTCIFHQEPNDVSPQPESRADDCASFDASHVHNERRCHLARYANELGFDSQEIRDMANVSVMFEERQSVGKITYVVPEERDAAVSRSGIPREDESQSERGQLFVEKLRSPCRDADNYITSIFVRRCFIDRVIGLPTMSA
jgi:Protein of unknown function (DUF3723)